tara:strand:- start:1488 stop:1847 length:360 start_codon:yes stop_codon:yes gene_type:complete
VPGAPRPIGGGDATGVPEVGAHCGCCCVCSTATATAGGGATEGASGGGAEAADTATGSATNGVTAKVAVGDVTCCVCVSETNGALGADCFASTFFFSAFLFVSANPVLKRSTASRTSPN